MKTDSRILLLAIGVLAPGLHLSAMTFSPSVGLGLQYTDNARLSSTNEQDDLIPSASIAVVVEESGGPLTFNLQGSVFHEHYIDDTYGDQTDLNLGGMGNWVQIPDRLSWQVSDHFRQTSVDSLGVNTPDNTQDTNAFNIGAEVILLSSPRNRLSINPLFRDFSYSRTDTDNQNYGLNAVWKYGLYSHMDAGLTGSVLKTEYDNETVNPGYTSNTLQAFVSGKGARTTYQVTIGATKIERDVFEDVDGATGSIAALYQLTGRTAVDVRASTALSDSSRNYLISASDPNSGTTTSQQVSGDILRTNIARLTLTRDDPLVPGRVWLEYQENDYEQAAIDRKSQAVGVDLTYAVNSLVNARAYTTYSRIKDTDIDRTDKRYIIGGNLVYRLSRSLSADFDLRYQEEDSTFAGESYEELRAVLGIVYGFGKAGALPRVGRQSRY